MSKPCDLPCPQCGSEDVQREFQPEGKDIGRDFKTIPEADICPDGFWEVSGSPAFWDITALKDQIKHHCRCCHYEWRTDPLPSPSKQKQGEEG